MRRLGLIIGILLCFVGCTLRPTEQRSVPEGNKYATGFKITEQDSCVIVEVFDPYQRICVTEPLQRLGTMSTVQIGFLYELDAMDHLVAVCNKELVYTPLSGDEIDLGDSMHPNAERVLQADLDALLAVNYGQYDNIEASKLEKLGVFTMYINEWEESSPLARAEWIRVFGALTGRLHEADSIFAEIEAKYIAQKSKIKNHRSTKVMSGNNFRGTWYVPSGKNYVAYLFKDAGLEYPFYDDYSTISIPLDIEKVINYFGDADVWVGADANSLAELKAMDEKHTWFKAYENKRVYNWYKQTKPGGASNFWERAVVHPEEILEDVINIAENAPDSLLHFAVRLR